MGLLDDAIREHLDLKRRRGADPDEIERAEREALGPVRRGPESEQGPDDSAAYDLESDSDWEGPYDDEAEDEPTRLHDAGSDPRPGGFEDPFKDDSFSEEAFTEPERTPAPRPHPAPGAEDEPVGGETVEYRVEESFEDEPVTDTEHPEHDRGKGQGEDVLEETPEFLQDTPDHDRLWFEQRPPRDFDFDG